MPIPQTTKRPKRADDDQALIQCLKPKDFNQQDFFVKHGNYGILSRDFFIFAESSSKAGTSVNGPNEISKLKKRYEVNSQSNGLVEVECINILVRYSNDRDIHSRQTSAGLKAHFSSAVANKRIMTNEQLDQEFYFNDQFIADHINIVLTRDAALSDWIYTVSQHLSVNSLQHKIP